MVLSSRTKCGMKWRGRSNRNPFEQAANRLHFSLHLQPLFAEFEKLLLSVNQLMIWNEKSVSVAVLLQEIVFLPAVKQILQVLFSKSSFLQED